MNPKIDKVWHGEVVSGKKKEHWRVWINDEWYKIFPKKSEAVAFHRDLFDQNLSVLLKTVNLAIEVLNRLKATAWIAGDLEKAARPFTKHYVDFLVDDSVREDNFLYLVGKYAKKIGYKEKEIETADYDWRVMFRALLENGRIK
jgi:hypothetical protein